MRAVLFALRTKARLKGLIFLGRASGITASGRQVHNTRVDLKLKSTLQNVILSRKCTTIRLQCSVTLPVEYSWRYTSGVDDNKKVDMFSQPFELVIPVQPVLLTSWRSTDG